MAVGESLGFFHTSTVDAIFTVIGLVIQAVFLAMLHLFFNSPLQVIVAILYEPKSSSWRKAQWRAAVLLACGILLMILAIAAFAFLGFSLPACMAYLVGACLVWLASRIGRQIEEAHANAQKSDF